MTASPLYIPSNSTKPSAGLIFLIATLSLGIWTVFSGFTLRIHSDDAMRLVQVRDLLAGQGWFDLTQYRLGVEAGTAMHWSRLVDAPIVLLILIAEPFAGRAGAETFAMIVWPLILFAGTILGLAMICLRLGGGRAALYGVVLASILVAQSGKFDPGSLDHHNVQILLLVTALTGFIYRRAAAKWAGMAGVALALSLGVGVETLPLIVLVCVVFALVWAIRGEVEQPAVLAFSAALGIALTAVYVLATPVAAKAGGFCDALSRDLYLPAIVGALGLMMAASLQSDKPARTRFLALGGIGGVAVVVVLLAAPACLSNPLDTLDPLLKTHWLDKVTETASLGEVSLDRMGYFAGSVIGLLIALWFMLRDARREAWGMLCLVIMAALVFAAYQSRGFPVVAALSVLPTALLAARLSEKHETDERVWSGIVMVCAVILSVPSFTSAVVLFVSGLIHPAPARAAESPFAIARDLSGVPPCTDAEDFQRLAAMAPGVVSAQPYVGSKLLLHTPHRTLAGPYHRNQAGLLAQLEIGLSDPSRTEALLERYGVDYVIRCQGDRQFGKDNPGMAVHLDAATLPDFLTRLEGDGPLAIYRVNR